MAGTLVADQLQDGAGNSTSMDNAIYGSAKAWVNFAGSTGTKISSYNVSSVTRNSSGNYTINYTNALQDTNYAVMGTINIQTSIFGAAAVFMISTTATPSTTNTTVSTAYSSGGTCAANDYASVCVAIFR